MQHPPPRQQRLVGSARAVLDSRTASGGAPARHVDPALVAPPSAPARRPRTTTAENPFASFYESRRKISLETDDEDETADPSSSITRAYIVPDSLLALARGERESSENAGLLDAGLVGDSNDTSVRIVATHRADVATESTSMFRFRSPPQLGLAAEWRVVQRIALQMAAWLRRAWRRSVPD